MSKNLTGKTILIFALLIFFLFGIIGIPKKFGRKEIADSIKDQVRMGLDLKGGTHLILQVMVDDAVNAETDNTMERLKSDIKPMNIPAATVEKPDPTGHPELLVAKGIPLERDGDFRTMVDDSSKSYSRDYDFKQVNGEWQFTMKPQVESELKSRAVTQSIETIRSRIDQLGVSEPVIEEHGLGQYQILVQLPGVDDPGQVKEDIQSTARLEFRLVYPPANFASLGYPDEKSAREANPVLSSDKVLLHGTSGGSSGQDEVFVVSRVAAVGGQDLRDADVGLDENNRPKVDFYLTAEGGKKMEAFTEAHQKDPMAVVLNNRVEEVATIESTIKDSGYIHGRYTQQQAQNLKMLLRSGSLPASIQFREERTVGPSLGADSIRQGVLAAIIGMGAVLLFMLIYYRGAGINADLALLLNLVILLGFMGYFHAVLTLPGIAGVILTVGMGVDSNVLIFERIREELRAGKAPVSAVDQGFSHAWITIIDTHVTTIVSAAFLFIFGTGPVKGFAVTLTFGLLANLFTAVFVSRVIFDAILNRKERGAALSI